MWIAGSLRGHGLDPHTPSWSGLMRTLYLVFIFLCRRVLTETGTQGYSLSTRDVYFAYSSDLEVRYLIPPGSSLPNAYIRLVWLGPREREITTLSMTLGRSSAALPVTCGVVEFPGLFAFQMFMQHDGLKLAETRFEVRWPVVHLSIPSEHTAQVDQFSISVRPETKCGGIVRKYMFWTELQYVGADRGSAVRNLVDPITVVKGHNFSISSMNATEVACDVVDQAGFYRAVLKSSYNTSMIIAKSNLMFVTWSDKYNLSSFYKSVFPCTKTLTLEYNQPLCPGRKDKIRVYKLVRTVQGSLAAPIELVYVMEMYAEKWGRALTLGCDTFDPDSVGYCFIYVSVSLTGAVREQRKHCLPTHEDAELVADGIWSSWSPWGQCSITCGNGKKSRFRMCNNPPPMNGGKFCVGDPVEWTACSSVCPELLSELTPLYSIKLDDRCACGCSMWNATGKIVATGRCTGLSVWKIRVKRDLRVKLSFVYLDFYKDMQWVQIRNGGSPDAELLAFSDGTNQLDDVFSTTNEMLVEFMTKTSTTSSGLSVVLLKPTESIHIHGFIAYYNVLNSNVSVLAAPQLTPITRPAWENAVTIGGVVVCVLVVIGALLFVFYHRLQRRRLRKYKMAKTESPTSPVHSKGTSAQTPSSPDELDSPGQDMETPLTGELKRKEYHKASGKSRGSVSSTSSAGYKRLRTKTDVEMGSGSKPSSRAHTPLQSPYAANAATDDFKHDQNFFKGYRPRSPKVHPSSKTRQSSKSPTSPPTKHSILTKALVERRKDEGESRVVIGASSTPPTSKDNSASNSMEAGGGVDGRKKKEKSVESREGKDKPRDKVKGVSDKDPSGSVKHRDKDESKHKPSSKSSNKRTKSSGVSTPVKNCVEMEVKGITPCETSAKHTTTEFTTKKARRPTSLTESYDSDKATVGKSPTQRTKFKFAKKREPPKESRSTTATGVEERQKCLPRPDGQSPENIREERRVAPSVSTPRSVKSLRSNHTLSPTKSIRSANTPSDMAELEYDDFIEDDPLSYFEYDEMLKLRWHGVEKIGKPIKEEDSASVALNGVGDR